MSTADRSYVSKNFNRGMNNLVPDSELTDRTNRGVEAYFLRDIVNADLLAGQLKRRKGTTLALVGRDCHSLWSGNGTTYFVDGSKLKMLAGPPSALTATTIFDGLAPARRVSFAAGPESVFISDGVVLLEFQGGAQVAANNPSPPGWSDAGAFQGETEDPLSNLPAGDALAYLNGRLYSAKGPMLFFSDPYLPRFYNPGKNYIPFPAEVTMVEPCQNGVYVSADQTYWIAGDPLAASLNPVLPYTAVRGTSGPVPNDNSCYWFSSRGVVIGSQDGSVKNLQEDTVSTGGATEGAAMFREEDGVKQIVAAVVGPKEAVLAARSFMDAEVIRKETIL